MKVEQIDHGDDDPMPMYRGVCDQCGQDFCNFSGKCLAQRCNRRAMGWEKP